MSIVLSLVKILEIISIDFKSRKEMFSILYVILRVQSGCCIFIISKLKDG